MPTYEYICPRCFNITEILKSMADFEREEECPKCAGQKMNRQISAVASNRSNCQFEPHFNHAFGKVVHNKREITELVRKTKYETGREIVEVGTDTLKSVKKKRTPYTVDYRD